MPTAADRLAEQIVDTIEATDPEFQFGRTVNWDHDEMRRLIAGFIPLSDAEYSEMLKEAAKGAAACGMDSPYRRLQRALIDSPSAHTRITLQSAIAASRVHFAVLCPALPCFAMQCNVM